MPEGDTLHKVARVLAPILTGQVVTSVHFAHQRAPLLVGQPIGAVDVHGKHIVLSLGSSDEGWCLRVHLGMYGSWHRYAPLEKWRRPRRQAGVVLEVPGHVVVCFNPQDVELWPQRNVSDRRVYEALGPDLLAGHVDFDEVLARARRQPQATPLVDILLDQRVAAGIGNVYKCELLFIHRWAPTTPIAQLDDGALMALFTSAQSLMQQNLGDWRRTTTYDRRQGREPGKARLYVYGRRGEACQRCQTPIVQARLGRSRRSTYWCPNCQKSKEPSP